MQKVYCQAIVVFLTTVIMGYLSSIAAEEILDFRGVNWGDSLNQIIALEGTPNMILDNGTLVYKNKKMRDYSVSIDFLFEEGCANRKDMADKCRFASGSYNFDDLSCNETTFADIENILTSKYGDIFTEKDDDFIGQHRHQVLRQIGNVRIRHGIRHKGDKCKSHFISYDGPYIQEIEKKKKDHDF